MNENKTLSRTIYLNLEINKESAGKIIKEICDINEEDDKKESELKEYTRTPIKLIMNSYGGVCYDGLAICAAIDSSKTPVHTYVYGYAMSMGLLISSFGKKRCAHELATFMYHSVSSWAEGKVETMREDVNEALRLRDLYTKHLLQRTKIPKERIEEVQNYKQDWFITAEEALELGIIDEII
ncbi:ATP-dependent Clp protease proteolytic subunit [Paenibacillus medicaginis]|uniref:ATP-dependent Clp protease proteolytic subunit n=1 Tax=Paenibacillus medicaginis TaxID=1470560 RepID=A0ABV5BUH8_9BACL